MIETDMDQLELTRERWKNRRRMAWVCMWAGICYPLLLIAQVDGATLSQISMPFYAFAGLVVSVYIGAATTDDYLQKKLDQ